MLFQTATSTDDNLELETVVAKIIVTISKCRSKWVGDHWRSGPVVKLVLLTVHGFHLITTRSSIIHPLDLLRKRAGLAMDANVVE